MSAYAESRSDRVLVPGGTGRVGEGVVRAHLAAGATVVVPTRSEQRVSELQGRLTGAPGREHLHVLMHDYSDFASADALAEQVVRTHGGIDSVVATVGGWWAGGPLAQIGPDDWRTAFVDLVTTHLAMLRACLPRMSSTGAYAVVVGESADRPVPGSGLVSMEQAAVLMMQRVAQAESGDDRRVFAMVLGQVRSGPQSDEGGDSSAGIAARSVGDVAVALSAATSAGGRILHLPDDAAAGVAVSELAASGS